MSEPRDLTGVWYGRYATESGDQDNSFIAVIEEQGGAVTGTVTEPDDSGAGGIRRATLAGQRTGSAVAFVKQYQGSAGWFHAVHYQGQVDGSGREVAGSWRINWLTGRFTMTREKFVGEELEELEEVEASAPLEHVGGRDPARQP